MFSLEDASKEKAAVEEAMRFTIDVVFPLLDRIKKKYKGRTFKGFVTCPKCKVKGALKVVQVIHSGKEKLRVGCSTKDCLSLME